MPGYIIGALAGDVVVLTTVPTGTPLDGIMTGAPAGVPAGATGILAGTGLLAGGIAPGMAIMAPAGMAPGFPCPKLYLNPTDPAV